MALVGPTGAGKSTIMKLLLGLYLPSQGRVLINGIDLRTLDLYRYRAELGIILQSESVFPGTILDNLTLGLSRPVSERDVRTCLNEARLLKRIEQLPEGLHAWVKDGLLSGGEQQRLIIARTFLRSARLVLMDEPTSALDFATEAEIGLMLNERMRNATTITIAHHLATVMAADIVFVISNGKIVESGDHTSLLSKRGLYSHLFGKSTIA